MRVNKKFANDFYIIFRYWLCAFVFSFILLSKIFWVPSVCSVLCSLHNTTCTSTCKIKKWKYCFIETEKEWLYLRAQVCLHPIVFNTLHYYHFYTISTCYNFNPKLLTEGYKDFFFLKWFFIYSLIKGSRNSFCPKKSFIFKIMIWLFKIHCVYLKEDISFFSV